MDGQIKSKLFGTNRMVYGQRRDGERVINVCIFSTAKHRGGNIMVWVFMFGTGLSSFVKINGIMDKKM